MKNVFKAFRCLIAAGITILVAVTPSYAQIRVLTKAGDAMPNNAGTVDSFGIPKLKRLGEPVVEARLVPPGGNEKRALIRIGPTRGAGRVLVAQGDPSPDANGNFPSNLESFFTNESGAVALSVLLSNALNNNGAIFYGGDDIAPLSLVVRQGQLSIGSLSIMPGLNNAGQTSFFAIKQDFSGFTLWRVNTLGQLTAIIDDGASAPGGGIFDLSVDVSTVMNQNGTLAVFAAGGDFLGIFVGNQLSSISEAFRNGSPTPSGNGLYEFFTGPRSVKINDQGNIALYTGFKNTSGGQADNIGIVLASGSIRTELVRKGAFTPDGNGRLALNETSFQSIRFNNRNEVLFKSSVSGASGGSDDGIFIARPSGLVQIARKNGPVPNGGTFTRILEIVGLNNAGTAVFAASYRPTPTSFDRDGLFAYKNGVVIPIAVVEQPVAGFGPINRLEYSTDAVSGALNEFDEVAFGFFYVQANSTLARAIGIWSEPGTTPGDSIFRNGFE